MRGYYPVSGAWGATRERARSGVSRPRPGPRERRPPMATLDCITITTLADLVTWIEPRLGETGSREVAERMADELRRYDDRPVWGADWSAWLREVCEDGR